MCFAIYAVILIQGVVVKERPLKEVIIIDLLLR